MIGDEDAVVGMIGLDFEFVVDLDFGFGFDLGFGFDFVFVPHSDSNSHPAA